MEKQPPEGKKNLLNSCVQRCHLVYSVQCDQIMIYSQLSYVSKFMTWKLQRT